MRYEEPEGYGLMPERRAGAATVIFISALTSVIVSALVVFATQQLHVTDASGLLARTIPAAVARADAGEANAPRVPEVIGLAAEVAEEKLSARKLNLVIRQRLIDTKLPAGVVLAQRPPAETRIHEGGAVEVMVSAGPPPSEPVGTRLDAGAQPRAASDVAPEPTGTEAARGVGAAP